MARSLSMNILTKVIIACYRATNFPCKRDVNWSNLGVTVWQTISIMAVRHCVLSEDAFSSEIFRQKTTICLSWISECLRSPESRLRQICVRTDKWHSWGKANRKQKEGKKTDTSLVIECQGHMPTWTKRSTFYNPWDLTHRKKQLNFTNLLDVTILFCKELK